jgi:hypothetical protein
VLALHRARGGVQGKQGFRAPSDKVKHLRGVGRGATYDPLLHVGPCETSGSRRSETPERNKNDDVALHADKFGDNDVATLNGTGDSVQPKGGGGARRG